MKDILSGWREHGLLKSKYMLIISIVIVLIITISGVMYYLHYKKTEKEALEKQQQQKFTFSMIKRKLQIFIYLSFMGIKLIILSLY
ncbi:hypothetical protein [Providencia huaxiensis]|uniref:hypothetical protein n=1 Tax=Providencia huaxiensis TaxID=2027290 RepID=UPI0034DD6481